MNTRLLQDQNAVVFGAGGSIGAAVAKTFAAEGARVFLAGRTKASLDAVAKQIAVCGGEVFTAAIDTLDDASVNQYVDRIVKQAGKIDIVLDAAGPRAKEYGNGKNAVDLPVDEFMVPLATMVKSRFITARAAARYMIKQHSGVIIFVTGSPARAHVPGATAIGAAFRAIENLAENLAFEVGSFGVRSVCLRTVANVDSRSIQDTMEIVAGQLNVTKDQVAAQLAQGNFLKVSATVQDTANAAALIASSLARMLTGNGGERVCRRCSGLSIETRCEVFMSLDRVHGGLLLELQREAAFGHALTAMHKCGTSHLGHSNRLRNC